MKTNQTTKIRDRKFSLKTLVGSNLVTFVLVALLTITLVGGAAVINVYLDDLPATATYVIKTDGTNYWAVRYDGYKAWESTNASYVFNSIYASGKVLVSVGEGRFTLTNNITMGDGDGMIGFGKNVTRLVASGNIAVINAIGSAPNYIRNIYISHLTIDGNKATYASSKGIVFTNTIRTLIEDVLVTNCGSDGVTYIKTDQSYENFLVNSWVGGDSKDGAPGYPYGNDGVGVKLGTDNHIVNCGVFQNGGDGIQLESSSKVEDSHIWGNQGNGVSVADGKTDWEISHNTIESNRQNGILIDGGGSGNIQTNQIWNNAETNQDLYDGIRISKTGATTPYANIISDNEIRDKRAYASKTQYWAINEQSGSYNQLLGNRVLGNRVNGAGNTDPGISPYIVGGSTYKNNYGFVTENGGRRTVANGEVIAHGIASNLNIGASNSTTLVTAYTTVYDSVPVVVGISAIDGTNITASAYWVNGTAITIDAIQIWWKVTYP